MNAEFHGSRLMCMYFEYLQKFILGVYLALGCGLAWVLAVNRNHLRKKLEAEQ